MFFDLLKLSLSLLLLSNYLLNALAAYTLGIRRDEGSPGMQSTYVWSSVAVYAADVDTTTFTEPQLYGLAQMAWNEMQTQFYNPDGTPAYGGSKRPFTMSAMAVGNLVYFSSSMKGTNYVQNSGASSDITIALQMCQAGLQAQAEPGVQVSAIHRNKASCGEVGCLLYQSRDTAAQVPGFNPDKRTIVAYGGPKPDNGMQMPCCGSPVVPGFDPSSWGCYQFMQSQNVDMPDITSETLELPTVEPLAIRYVSIC